MRTALKLGILIFCWVLVILLTTAISPSYLVEGSRNHLGFQFSSKETYVLTVNVVQFCYVLLYVILIFVSLKIIKCWRAANRDK